ncbi:NADH dehydrogenase [ubiquinone] 1 alpha subcomplex subunit 1-like [Carcharodon carcharias]|uniref:NADH dehydrogenase [ubiquinone] 1 alpha subcomplex subunit 1-like n=1 Tax=Carcharodon carcharias TaxID=13397 RepID=UPI001B7F717E|nr:NADH dehydrogenase [ubiquinone] 1 alpha subcomplex subunit 1-like [Carcharodon carcharias]
MWYEILPGLCVMAGCLMVLGLATIYLHRGTNDSRGKWIAHLPCHWTLLDQDRGASGCKTYYKSRGLENID